jgi:hypothetical protein
MYIKAEPSILKYIPMVLYCGTCTLEQINPKCLA